MTDKDKIVTINGKKYIEKKWTKDCDEPFKYLEELPKRKRK